LFPAFGETQFQILCLLAPVSLVTTVIITCTCIKEIDPKLLFTFPGQEQEESKGGIQAALSVSPRVLSLTTAINQHHAFTSPRQTNLQHSILRMDRLVSMFISN
jgi:hypothetical protein